MHAIRNTHVKTDLPVYETINAKDSESGANVQLQGNPSYGKFQIYHMYTHVHTHAHIAHMCTHIAHICTHMHT